MAAAWEEVYWLFAAQLIAEEARFYQQAHIDPVDPLRPYRLVRRIEETADVASFVLEPADGQARPAIAAGRYGVGVRRPARWPSPAAPVHRLVDGDG